MLKIKAKTVLLTTMDMETNHLLYPYVIAMNDVIIREILQTIEIHSIKNNQNLNYLFIPEIAKENSSDNVIILEWWISETDSLVEYRFSLYQGSDGLSRVIDRGTLPSGNILLNLDERNRIINNLVDYLHE